MNGRPVSVSAGSGYDDTTVRVWDLTTRDPIGEPIVAHPDGVVALAVGEVTLAAGLPADPVEICRAVNGLLHPFDAATLPQERMAEKNPRPTSAIARALVRLDSAPCVQFGADARIGFWRRIGCSAGASIHCRGTPRSGQAVMPTLWSA